ncbi:hypothetical protein RIF29_10645 [Crotalaria pallida]|uniref:Secreted protein n=1 Tax=Crotalaria pallida TaxID=3830 RepID=A0AAN9FSY2_CROPI
MASLLSTFVATAVPLLSSAIAVCVSTGSSSSFPFPLVCCWYASKLGFKDSFGKELYIKKLSAEIEDSPQIAVIIYLCSVQFRLVICDKLYSIFTAFAISKIRSECKHIIESNYLISKLWFSEHKHK